MEKSKKESVANFQPGGGKAVESGNATLSLNSILQKIIDVKYGQTTAGEVAREFVHADENKVRYSYAREDFKVSEQQRTETRNYFVGDTVELNGERGTVAERQLLKNGEVVYTVDLDNGARKKVSPDELTVSVTTDFHFNELPEEDRDACWERNRPKIYGCRGTCDMETARRMAKAVGYTESKRFKEDIRYAYGNEEEDSVKSRMRNHLGQLNAMKIVAEIDSPGITWRNRKELGDYLVEVLKKSGYKVERRNFGMISFDEGLLRESAKYIQNEIEAIAYESIPRVLKRGIEVGQHKDHKARGLDTVTFAAPIEINGERCNVAVVVKINKGNRFKVLRILAVTGTKVKIKKDIVLTTGGGLSQKRTHATPIGTISNRSISDSSENDNRKFA